MSISILKDPATQPTVLDDLQSIYWVLLYGSFRYFYNGATVDWRMFFERYEEKNKGFIGGRSKRLYFEGRGLENLRDFTSLALRRLIYAMETQWREYYGKEADLNDLYYDCSLKGPEVKPKDSDVRKLDEARMVKRREISEPSFWIALFDECLLADDPFPVWHEEVKAQGTY